MNKLQLSNIGHRLMVKVDNKLFEVVAVCRNTKQANSYCAAHDDCGVIDEDKNGNVYIANDREFSR